MAIKAKVPPHTHTHMPKGKCFRYTAFKKTDREPAPIAHSLEEKINEKINHYNVGFRNHIGLESYNQGLNGTLWDPRGGSLDPGLKRLEKVPLRRKS